MRQTTQVWHISMVFDAGEKLYMANMLQIACALRLPYWRGSRRSSRHHTDDFKITSTHKMHVPIKNGGKTQFWQISMVFCLELC